MEALFGTNGTFGAIYYFVRFFVVVLGDFVCMGIVWLGVFFPSIHNFSPTRRRLPTYVALSFFANISSPYTSRRSFRENKNEWKRTKTHCTSVSPCRIKQKNVQLTLELVGHYDCGDGIWTSWPPGYEPDELPDCSTPRYSFQRWKEGNMPETGLEPVRNSRYTGF